jgi:hypothetical protein
MSPTRLVVGCVIGMLAAPVVARAQAIDTFERLIPTLKEGQSIVITDTGGGKTTGKVIGVSPSSLTVRAAGAEQSISAASVSRITMADSLQNGVLIGLGVGAGVGAALAVADNSSRCQTSQGFCIKFDNGVAALAGALVGAGLGLGIGLGIDAALRPRLLYQSSGPAARAAITPILGTSAYGLRLAWRW